MKRVWIVRCKKALLVCESIMLLVIVSAFAGRTNGIAYANETVTKEQKMQEVHVKEENADVSKKEDMKMDSTQETVESKASEEVEATVKEIAFMENKQSEVGVEVETETVNSEKAEDTTSQEKENTENIIHQESTTTESDTTQENELTEDTSTSETESDTSEEPEYIEPNVKISIEPTEGWFKDTALVYVKVEDIVNSGNFVIESVKAKISQNGSWVDITEDMRFSVSENCSVYVQVTDQNGKTYERNRYISCFDKTKPVLNAAVNGGLLSVQAKDNESGVLAVYVNGYEFTELNNGVLNVRLQQFDTGYEYFTIQAVDRAGNISEVYRTVNPYYEDPLVEKKEEAPLPESATPTEPTDAEANVTEHTTQAEKEFYTIQTDSEKVFYLIIDKTGEQEKVYFLTEISERDLLNVTSDNSETLPMNSAVVESALPNETPKIEITEKIENTEEVETTEVVDLEDKETGDEAEQESEKTEPESNSAGIYIVMVVVGVIAIGLGYYFKVIKKKEDFEDEEKLEDEVFEKEDEVENETEEDFFDKQEDF